MYFPYWLEVKTSIKLTDRSYGFRDDSVVEDMSIVLGI